MNTTDTITIRTDKGELMLPSGCTPAQALDYLLPKLGKPADAVATAVNGAFVSRGMRDQHILNDGDTVLCFSPITGG